MYSQNLAVVVARGTHAKKALAFLSRGDNHSNAETQGSHPDWQATRHIEGNVTMTDQGLMTRKSVAAIIIEAGEHTLGKTLGPLSITALGIGCIIGAGIFVLTGTAAAHYAGPGIMLSFVVGGIACAFVGLCYAELAALLPVSGSTYTYTYATWARSSPGSSVGTSRLNTRWVRARFLPVGPTISSSF